MPAVIIKYVPTAKVSVKKISGITIVFEVKPNIAVFANSVTAKMEGMLIMRSTVLRIYMKIIQIGPAK
jgi:hypothetical protein